MMYLHRMHVHSLTLLMRVLQNIKYQKEELLLLMVFNIIATHLLRSI